MTDLKRYNVFRTTESVFIDGCEMNKCSDVDPILAENEALKEQMNRECVWTRHGSAATEEWFETACGFDDIGISQWFNDIPTIYCQNCGGKIKEGE